LNKQSSSAEVRHLSGDPSSPHRCSTPGWSHYDIIVAGHLDEHWAQRFGEMSISHLTDGNTRLSGKLPDQPALHGVLVHIRDLGLTLISLKRTDS
jgi:hypothetical protein